MEATLEEVRYDEVFSLVKQLPFSQRMRLTKELDNENIGFQLSSLLSAFQTDDLSLDSIDSEVEIVRQQIYDRKKHENQSYL